jgi:monoamine oxidase
MEEEWCQLKIAYEAGHPPTPMDKGRSMALRINSSIKRRTADKISNAETIAEGTAEMIKKAVNALTTPPGKLFEAGDLVEVLSMAEIKQTLDEHERCERLQFMRGMERFEKKQFTVLKNVKTIFDERAQKMVGVKNTVILNTVVCDGRDLYDKEGCDRSCFFFWKTHWLKKVEASTI